MGLLASSSPMNVTQDPELRRRLVSILLGSRRGGESRARIIKRIRIKPVNTNQLAVGLHIQYKAVQHHLRILKESALVITSGEGYGAVHMLNPWFERHIDVFEQICATYGVGRVDPELQERDVEVETRP